MKNEIVIFAEVSQVARRTLEAKVLRAWVARGKSPKCPSCGNLLVADYLECSTGGFFAIGCNKKKCCRRDGVNFRVEDFVDLLPVAQRNARRGKRCKR